MNAEETFDATELVPRMDGLEWVRIPWTPDFQTVPELLRAVADEWDRSNARDGQARARGYAHGIQD